MQGYMFVSGTQRKTAEFYVKEGNGAERLINGDTYSVQGDVTSVDLIYKIGEKEKRIAKSNTVLPGLQMALQLVSRPYSLICP